MKNLTITITVVSILTLFTVMAISQAPVELMLAGVAGVAVIAGRIALSKVEHGHTMKLYSKVFQKQAC